MGHDAVEEDDQVWSALLRARKRKRPVTGTVLELVRGGLILDVGVRGFLPSSLVELRRVRDLEPYVGRTLEVLVVEVDRSRNSVVLSRKDRLQQIAPACRAAFLSGLQPGDVWAAVVSEVHNDGVVVDFGDFAEGVIMLADLSDRPLDHPGEIVEVGDRVHVRVLSVDEELRYACCALAPSREGHRPASS